MPDAKRVRVGRGKARAFNEVIDTSLEKLGDGVRRITGGYGADIVINGVGGEVLSEALGALAAGGKPPTTGDFGGRQGTHHRTQLNLPPANTKNIHPFSPPPAAPGR